MPSSPLEIIRFHRSFVSVCSCLYPTAFTSYMMFVNACLTFAALWMTHKANFERHDYLVQIYMQKIKARAGVVLETLDPGMKSIVSLSTRSQLGVIRYCYAGIRT